jgi:hypothetical protein
MPEVLELTANESKPDTAAKRGLIESELRKDAGRSDRELGRVCGVDGKTVSAVRAKLAPSAEFFPQQPTPTEQRQMLIAGAEHFNKLYPPGPAEPATAEEQVDEAIADGKVSTGGAGDAAVARQDATVQAAVDQCRGHLLRLREERRDNADAAGEKNEERTILPAREEVTIQHDTENCSWILRQRRWPDEDAVIVMSDADIHEFVDILTDHLGYGRVP